MLDFNRLVDPSLVKSSLEALLVNPSLEAFLVDLSDLNLNDSLDDNLVSP